jgi:hypothetical protein
MWGRDHVMRRGVSDSCLGLTLGQAGYFSSLPLLILTLDLISSPQWLGT